MKRTLRSFVLASASLFASLPGVSLAACLAPPSGLVSWWPGDDNAFDFAGFNHGALRSGASYGDGKVGRGFSFDGTSNYVQSTTWGLAVGARDFTFVGWARTTATKSLSALVVSEGRSPALYVTGAGALTLYPASVVVGSGFNDGQFHHFAVTRSNGVVNFFKDGALIGTTPYTGSLNPGRWLMGSSGLSGEEFSGVVDEVAFFDRALATSEIAALFAASTDGMCKPAPPSLPFFIEAEDFDFNGGQHRAEADAMPYLGAAYAGLSATAEVDYHDPGSNENAEYRPASQSVALFGSGDVYRDAYSVAGTYKVGYCDAGDWFNYTRVFPAPGRNYRIYARLASGAAASAVQLDEVTSGLGTSNQVLAKIGQALGPASGGWDNFNSVPVTDDSGNPVTVNFSGQKTIRVTILPGGNEDVNYLLFVPVEAVNNVCVASAPGLAAWWSGDGHRFDLQGTNHGTLRNGATYTAGRVGEGFTFDGVDDYVETALDVQPSAMPATSWECWVFPTRFDGIRRQILGSDDGGFDRSLLTEGGSFGIFVGYGVWYPVGLTPNQWQHIAVVFTTNNVEFYKNGVRFSFGAAPAGQATGSRLNIGRSPNFGEYFQGRIDEVGIYNRALTPAEISAIYAAANAGRCKPASPCPTIALTPASLPASEHGAVFNQTLNASVGTAPYNFAAVSALPPGLSLSSNGVLSGMLMNIGQFAFTIRATDNNGCSTPQNFTLNVIPRTPPCANLPGGLVSWWRAEGDAQDALGVGHGAALNGVAFVPGKVGQAFSFTSVTNRIPVATNGLNVGTGDFTVEGWVKTTTTKDYSAILGFDGYNPAIYLRGGSGLQFYPSPISLVGGFNDGRFHHFAVVRTSGQITYYKDGFAAGTVAGATPLNAQNILIGSDTVAGEQFEGILDELTFYSRALAANEVRAIYSQGSGGKCGPIVNTPTPTNAVADYRFEYALGSSVGSPPNLQPINSIAFTNATVDGSARPVLAFPVGSGLSLAPTTGLVASNNYSVVMLLRFDAVNGYRRILDTYGGISDEGLYCQDGGLRYYPSGNYGANPPFVAGQWAQVVFTRGAENFMEGFVEGGLQFSAGIAAGTAVIGANNSLRFFRDDGGDLGSGQVARIRVFSPALTPEQVAALDRLVPASGNVPDIALSATNLNFGNVTNGTSNELSLVISNVGTSTLTVLSLTTNHSAFRVVSPAVPFSVAAGAQVAVTLRFSPTSTGSYTGNLAIASSDPDEAMLVVALAGNGVSPPAPAPDIALNTTNLNFGNVTVGQNSNLVLTVSNVGPATLTVTSLTTNNPVFRVVSPSTPFNVFAGSQTAVTVRFTPTSAGLQNGNLAVTSNDPDEGTLNVALVGAGVNPPNVPDIALSATSLNFGNVTVGQSNNLTLAVSNVGTGTLTVTSLTTNNPVFRVVSPATPFNVATGAQSVVTLRFSPTSAGQQNGSLSIASNDPDEANLAVTLAGTGVTNSSGQTNLCITATNGLVSWWRAENLAADSQGTNHGILRNGATYAPGKVGQGFSFTGASSHVEVTMGEMSVGSGDFTVEGWILMPSGFPPPFSTIMSFGGVAIYLRDTDGFGDARLDLWPANPAAAGTGFADGQLHHFSVVRQGTGNNNVTYYKDGANIGTASHAFPLNTNKCSLGWDFASQNYPFTGILDELSFYKRALSAAEIQAIANAGSAGKCVGSGGGGGTNVPPPSITAVAPLSAAPGSLVTIAGTNFGSNPNDVSVRFADSWGFVQSVSFTQLVVTVPFGISGSVPLTVAVGAQTSASVSFGVQASSLVQPQGRITSATLTPSNQVRLMIEPAPPNSNGLLLEASDSPVGPWWKEPEFQWNLLANGSEFFTPLKAYFPERYYRFSLLSKALSSVSTLPFIQFISPNANVRPGLSVSLLGANFDPTPGGNAVRFQLPGQTWIATVTQATTNFLVVTVPTNLPASTVGTGTVYRVTVTTSRGTGNGVGCTVLQTAANTLMVRPTEAYINQPPGSGRQTLIVGGGVPPYQLVPQTTNDLAIAVATLNGVVLDIVARTNTKFGSISVGVDDSSVPPQRAWANVGVLSLTFAPTFDASFHTLLAGSKPGLTMTIHAATAQTLRIERMELRLQNAGLEVSRLHPGQIVALLKLFYSGTVYDLDQLSVTEVNPGRAKFDVLSFAKGAATVVAQGELIESPPTIVINVPNLRPVAMAPQPVDEELIFADDLLRLPAGAGQSFSLTATFTSVSIREDVYLPQTKTQTRSFTNTVLSTGAPRIDRVLPVHGEVNRNVRLRGTGFGATLADNLVTFTTAGGTNVPAKILLQTPDEIVVTVPREAISGPVQLTVGGKVSNGFLFYVRFHPDSVVLFDSFTNNLPTPLRLIHQQPIDDYETLGEVAPQTVICTMNGGHIVVTNLSLNQVVGTALVTSFYNGRQSTNLIVYTGQETNAPQRHIFAEVPNVGSSYVFARLYYSEGTNGVTLQLTGGDALFPLYPGGMYDFQFTAPIYRPPATPGTDVAVRVETVSQQWMAIPDDYMRVIVNSTRRVR